MKDVHSWVQPLQVVGLGLIKLLDMLLKHGENAVGGIAGFESVCERVRERIHLDRKSTRLNSSHAIPSRMPSSA